SLPGQGQRVERVCPGSLGSPLRLCWSCAGEECHACVARGCRAPFGVGGTGGALSALSAVGCPCGGNDGPLAAAIRPTVAGGGVFAEGAGGVARRLQTAGGSGVVTLAHAERAGGGGGRGSGQGGAVRAQPHGESAPAP